MPRVELTGGFNSGSALQFNGEECQNMVPIEVSSNGGKGKYKLRSVWGTEEHCEFERGGWVIGSHTITPNKYSDVARMFVLVSENGTLLYEIDVFGVCTLVHTFTEISDSDAYVRFADNGEVLCIVDGNQGWFYNLNNGAAALITDAEFPANPIDVVFLDTYFLWLDSRGSSGNIYLSDSYATDPTDCVNALDFTTAESQPDNSIGLQVYNNELVVFGNRSIEFFYNSGNVDFPFERNSGATQNIGANAIETIVKMNDFILFHGNTSDGESDIYMLNGYSVKPLSDQSMSKVLDDKRDEKKFAISIKEESSYLYCLLTTDKTYCFDIKTGLWSTRISTFVNGIDQPYGSKHKVYFNGYNYFFNTKTVPLNTIPTAYKQKKDVYTTDEVNTSTLLNEPINLKRKVILKHITAENKNIQINYFEMDIQKGVGNIDDPNPIITLSISRDGGMTYGNSITMTMGSSGDYKQRARVDMLGTSRDTVFKVESTSPVQQEWFTAYMDYEVMSE
jgi:hypothetical protein